ncbi:hypothetical protein KR009_010271 [Drosophila setifemur]|nr:hypothetical protein KR009_010271 [Drosophila setifemur]
MARLISIPLKIYIWCFLVLCLIVIWNVYRFNSSIKLILPLEEHYVEESFYVNSARCQIPFVEPFNDEVMEVYKPMQFIPCTNQSDLITVHYDKFLNRYVLHVNEEVIHEMLQSTEQPFACYYQKIIYGRKADLYDRLGNKTRFMQDFLVPLDVEGMLVECHTGDTKKILQEDAFVFVQHKKKPRRSDVIRKPSIIMYGIDTVSRTNLRRTMPMVFEFLNSPGWYEMMGYNKVADNSFPNIFAMLTGFLPETAKIRICDTDDLGCLDEIPFIWRDLKEAGYLTAYAEDEGVANTFTYAKYGFSEKPTDYYFRPFLIALEENTRIQVIPGSRMKHCLGRRLANSYIYDYCRQFMQRFVADRPIWGMFWSNHFSHADTFMPSAMEHKVLKDLLNFEEDGAFEHTIMIFFSDHGARFGPLMRMKEAFLEERLPMMFIYLPPWFRRKYPQYAMALAQNQNRLSSNFDLYNTFRHILQIGQMEQEFEGSWSNDCPQCQSLFYPLPENRSCSQAAIAEAYCTCHRYEKVMESPLTWRMADLVVDRINQYLLQNNVHRNLCSNLTLRYVNFTEQRVDNFDKDNWGKAFRHYHSKFQVHQNYAEFFATILYNRDTEDLKLNVEHISRINVYGDDSFCMKNKILKLYCICLTKLKT